MSCKILRAFAKTNWEELDYPISYAALLASGETIQASTWVVPVGLTEISRDFGADSTVVELGGGTASERYVVANRITTSNGRKFERAIVINVCTPE